MLWVINTLLLSFVSSLTRSPDVAAAVVAATAAVADDLVGDLDLVHTESEFISDNFTRRL